MPCFCYISDECIEPEMKQIRNHVKEIVKIAKIVHSKGDLYSDSGPLPRSILQDIHKLIDDIYWGKCKETGADLL